MFSPTLRAYLRWGVRYPVVHLGDDATIGELHQRNLLSQAVQETERAGQSPLFYMAIPSGYTLKQLRELLSLLRPGPLVVTSQPAQYNGNEYILVNALVQ